MRDRGYRIQDSGFRIQDMSFDPFVLLALRSLDEAGRPSKEEWA